MTIDGDALAPKVVGETVGIRHILDGGLVGHVDRLADRVVHVPLEHRLGVDVFGRSHVGSDDKHIADGLRDDVEPLARPAVVHNRFEDGSAFGRSKPHVIQGILEQSRKVGETDVLTLLHDRADVVECEQRLAPRSLQPSHVRDGAGGSESELTGVPDPIRLDALDDVIPVHQRATEVEAVGEQGGGRLPQIEGDPVDRDLGAIPVLTQENRIVDRVGDPLEWATFLGPLSGCHHRPEPSELGDLAGEVQTFGGSVADTHEDHGIREPHESEPDPTTPLSSGLQLRDDGHVLVGIHHVVEELGGEDHRLPETLPVEGAEGAAILVRLGPGAGDEPVDCDGAEAAVLVGAEPLLTATPADVPIGDPGIAVWLVEIVDLRHASRFDADHLRCPVAPREVAQQASLVKTILLVGMTESDALDEPSEGLTRYHHVVLGVMCRDDASIALLVLTTLAGADPSVDTEHEKHTPNLLGQGWAARVESNEGMVRREIDTAIRREQTIEESDQEVLVGVDVPFGNELLDALGGSEQGRANPVGCHPPRLGVHHHGPGPGVGVGGHRVTPDALQSQTNHVVPLMLLGVGGNSHDVLVEGPLGVGAVAQEQSDQKPVVPLGEIEVIGWSRVVGDGPLGNPYPLPRGDLIETGGSEELGTRVPDVELVGSSRRHRTTIREGDLVDRHGFMNLDGLDLTLTEDGADPVTLDDLIHPPPALRGGNEGVARDTRVGRLQRVARGHGVVPVGLVDEQVSGITDDPGILGDLVPEVASADGAVHLAAVDQVEVGVLLDGLHEGVGDGYRDVEVGDLTLDRLGFDEGLDVGMVDAEDTHVGPTPRPALGDLSEPSVIDPQKPHRPRCSAHAPFDDGVGWTQVREGEAVAPTGLLDGCGDFQGLEDRGTPSDEVIVDGEHEAGSQLTKGCSRSSPGRAVGEEGQRGDQLPVLLPLPEVARGEPNALHIVSISTMIREPLSLP